MTTGRINQVQRMAHRAMGPRGARALVSAFMQALLRGAYRASAGGCRKPLSTPCWEVRVGETWWAQGLCRGILAVRRAEHMRPREHRSCANARFRQSDAPCPQQLCGARSARPVENVRKRTTYRRSHRVRARGVGGTGGVSCTNIPSLSANARKQVGGILRLCDDVAT